LEEGKQTIAYLCTEKWRGKKVK